MKKACIFPNMESNHKKSMYSFKYMLLFILNSKLVRNQKSTHVMASNHYGSIYSSSAACPGLLARAISSTSVHSI